MTSGEEARIPIHRFTQEAYDQLKNIAGRNPALWLDSATDFAAVLREEGIEDYTEETGVVAAAPFNLRPVKKGAPHRGDYQGLSFYVNLQGVTPKVATDERMWAWITHFKMHAYSLKRWRIQTNTKLDKYVQGHWFVDAEPSVPKNVNRARRPVQPRRERPREGLWMYNTASRLWWIAHTAIKAADASGGAFTAEDVMENFARYAVHYHILISKYNYLRSPIVLAEVVRALLNEAVGMKAEKGLYALTKHLNLLSGTYLLDVMPRAEIRRRVLECVDEIMRDPELVRDRTKLRGRAPFRSLNLGAGVQSTVLALMADSGEYGLPKPDVAIFADTGWEPPEVYEHLEWLKSQLSFEVVTVRAGDIRSNLLSGVRPNGKPYLGIPAHLVNSDGTKGVSKRQCTDDYKIRPIQAWLRDRLGLEYGKRAPKDVQVEMWLGISADESMRQKASRDEWITRRYPLIEQGFTRYQLLTWFMERYPGRYLPRSSCIGCPYKSDSEWKRLAESDPASFRQAVEVDSALRDDPVVSRAITAKGGRAYLHRSRKPLDAVDFSAVRNYDDVMAEECDGLCGV